MLLGRMNHLDIPGSVVDLELGGVCSQPLFPGEKMPELSPPTGFKCNSQG